MPTNTNDADIAVLKAEMRDTREDVKEIKETISNSTQEQKDTLRSTVIEFREIFATHARECREDKKAESEARKGIYERIADLERNFATINVRFDLKRDWLKLVIALAMLGLGLLQAYREFGG